MNELTQNNKKWWANALLIGAVVGLACLPIGALGTKLGIWGFQGGFALLAGGVVLATIVFFLGTIAAVWSMAKGMRAERSSIFSGVAISVVILVAMGSQFLTSQAVPPIHNISTDTDNPPQFDKIVALREAEQANPLEYDREKLAGPQQEAYPQVKPLISDVGAEQMLSKVVSVLEAMGLEIVATDAASGRVEATDETFWFGFKDDVVVRVRPEGAGSVVDVRSVSRVGLSDLGKNAERIGEIFAGINSH